MGQLSHFWAGKATGFFVLKADFASVWLRSSHEDALHEDRQPHTIHSSLRMTIDYWNTVVTKAAWPPEDLVQVLQSAGWSGMVQTVSPPRRRRTRPAWPSALRAPRLPQAPSARGLPASALRAAGTLYSMAMAVALRRVVRPRQGLALVRFQPTAAMST